MGRNFGLVIFTKHDLVVQLKEFHQDVRADFPEKKVLSFRTQVCFAQWIVLIIALL